ncbi:MAG: sigma-70 family RNA polymerase sigma factor, partial [Clostridia bacterium]
QADVQPLLTDYCQTRDRKLRNELVEHYLYIPQMVARRFAGRGVEYDDLLQGGAMALVKALDRFDDGRGLQFVTFATPTVAGEVRNYIRDRAPILRMPRRGRELYVRICRMRDTLTQQFARQPALEEIAEAMDMPLDDLLASLEMHHAGQTLSLDGNRQEDTDAPTLASMLGQEEMAFETVENRDALMRAMQEMAPDERQIIEKRLLLQQSQREVARQLGISQMQVSRVERRVLEKLRKIWTE